ncbi:methyltransferase domain-containing protein [bacterium]|nr:methyltransferase domain-containing protein [bacterium]
MPATLIPPLATAAVCTAVEVEDGCPLCGAKSQIAFHKHAIAIRDCRACGHRFARPEDATGHVDRVYSDAYFFGGGAGYSDYVSESALLRKHGLRYALRLAKYVEPGTALDVGAAAGFVLQGLIDGGWTGQGLEPNDAIASVGRQLGLSIHTGTLEEFQTRERFDLVSMIQVMGHFLTPRVAAERVSSLVKPGGHCLIETWNVRSLTARLFGATWHEYSPPSVLQWFSPQTVATLFADFGFKPVAQGIPSKAINAGHAKSLLRHKASDSFVAKAVNAVAAVIPDRLTLPYPSEDLFWMLLRKQ